MKKTANSKASETKHDSVSHSAESSAQAKKIYQAPRIEKKRSVARVTLFSGGGAIAGGLTAAG